MNFINLTNLTFGPINGEYYSLLLAYTLNLTPYLHAGFILAENFISPGLLRKAPSII